MNSVQGVIAPILTPFEKDGSVARDLWVSHAKWVLAQGAHYLSPFGTTGEALSLSSRERMQALEWLVDAGIPPAKMMPGTGLTALPETVELSRHAVELGCAGVMVLPSFFYTAVGDNGQARYFGELIDKVASLQKSDGSWSGEKRFMEDNPTLVTSYVLLALNEAVEDLRQHPAGVSK